MNQQEFFKNIPQINYEGLQSDNPFAFRWYDENKIVAGKPMKEWFRFAGAYWHSFCGSGADPFGEPTHLFPWNQKQDVLEKAKDKADAAFEFLTKLRLPFYCFHDVDAIDYGNDMAENESRLQSISDYFLQKQIPLTQIIYLTNCANGQEVYENFCLRKNKTPEMKMEYFPVFRIDKCNVDQAIQESLISKYQPGPRKKTFLCFNRRYNDHRLMLYLAIVQHGLIDQCYYSMDKTQPEANRTFVENCKYLLTRFPDMELTSQDVLAADKLLPLVLDNPNFSYYPMENSVDPVQHLYNDSLINIITETYFFNSIIHITEKTYKPIAFMQPFILLGAAGSLQHIKDMGFKTFSEFWDESYDFEKDDKKRFKMITDIIKSIASWPDHIKIDFTYAVKNIVDYNVSHLNTMQDIEIDNLVEKYGT
jgi:hypothetical protein